MRRVALLFAIIVLVVSLAAPSGAAFATEGTVGDEVSIERDEEETPEAEPKETSEALLVSDEGTMAENQPIVVDDTPDDIDEPVPEVPETPPLPPIVIAQIQVGVSGDSSDEYVSIYNNGSTVVDVTGWCVRNKSKVFACLDTPDTEYSMDPGAYIGFSRHPDRPGEHGFVISLQPGSNHIVASNNTIQLVQGDMVIDSISWTSQPSGAFYALERDWDMLSLGQLQVGNSGWSWKKSLAVYGRVLELIECGDGVVVLEGEECPAVEVANPCSGLVISEIAANVDTQFIELYNENEVAVSIAGCRLQTNRNSKVFVFPEQTVLEAHGFTAVSIADTDLTLTKTTSGEVYLLSSDGRVEVTAVAYSNLSKDTSWAFVEGGWVQTYKATPGSENIYLQYPPCEDGYVRNIDTGRCNRLASESPAVLDCGEGRERNPGTGRCRNIPTVAELAPCKEGQYRSEETNRCRSIAVAVASVLKPCADDQFRNPLTNRCKKIASSDDIALADCGEGRERNPVTNRCRNILASTPPNAAFAVEPIKDSADAFIGWWALGVVVLAGTTYGVWEWREEISRILQRAGKPGRPRK